ncbi:MAG TPA: potassium transporter Kup [Kiloniellales bacterium]|nr:potassium transporter Kup [Kiloniellales bacterium]
MTSLSAEAEHASLPAATRPGLLLAVLGVVFGDIGTSPLYAFKLSIEAAGDVSEATVLGVLSLMFWSLILVVTTKYVLVILRADNRGEGGILAATTLALAGASRTGRRHQLILLLGLAGAALFYGDCVITPAISVLSAVEGLEVVAPALEPYVLPVTAGLLVGLFLLQRHGTARVGALFGPVMLAWFATLALLGLLQIIAQPGVLRAIDPRWAIEALTVHPLHALTILGAVVLTVTGAEALYADLGHFGRKPISFAWLWVVFPALLLNYAGQAALVLNDPSAAGNTFYRLAPDWALIPLVILASAATIIASQAVISAAFSLMQQAVQLGYMPRLQILHTSQHARGQVYVPLANTALLAAVLFVVFEFKSSEALGAAYGVAVTGTMILSTILTAAALRYAKGWHWLWLILFGLFFVVDMLFLGATLSKVADGGWLPLAIAGMLLVLMTTWMAGRERMLALRLANALSMEDFLTLPTLPKIPRVAGTACYLVAEPRFAPTALLHNLKHNKVLHERIVILGITVAEVPRVAESDRVRSSALAPGIWSVALSYGFLEQPDIPEVLPLIAAAGLEMKVAETSFIVGREKITAGRKPGLATWRKRLFILLHRAMLSATEFFHIPASRVVELGGQIEI